MVNFDIAFRWSLKHIHTLKSRTNGILDEVEFNEIGMFLKY